MEYLHVFNSEADFNTAYGGDFYKEPWVSATNIGVSGASVTYRVNYNKSKRQKLLETPLTFEITSAGNIVWKALNTAYTVTLEYSKDSGQNWTQITSTTGGTSISVSAGDTVQFRCGTDDGYGTLSNSRLDYNAFSGTTAGFKVKGNIMSLLSKNNFTSIDTLQSAYTFNYLFQQCTGLTDASKLVLPATTLTDYCYCGMFANCTSLTTAPELPATTLANHCYDGMFQACTSLTTAPALPATTLAVYCYSSMFSGCSSLTTAPVLPATTLGLGCYDSMFKGCSSLTTAPELPATTLANHCYDGMFQACTSLTTAPALPATTLAKDCYRYMFYYCSHLNYIKAMFITTPGSNTYFWVMGVASTGTFVKNSAATWDVTGTSGIPTGWTVQTATS